MKCIHTQFQEYVGLKVQRTEMFMEIVRIDFEFFLSGVKESLR